MIIRIALVGGGTGGHMNPLLRLQMNCKQPRIKFTHHIFRSETTMVDEFEIRDIAIFGIASSKLVVILILETSLIFQNSFSVFSKHS